MRLPSEGLAVVRFTGRAHNAGPDRSGRTARVPARGGVRERQGVKDDYARAAEFLNHSDARLVSIQHEHGIFGGDDGAYVLDLVSGLHIPAVATLHTVLKDPSDSQRSVIEALCSYLQAADIFISPYQNETQVTSGALSYAMGAGAAAVSTPYWHAQELLADGRGHLFPFGDSAALGGVLASLLRSPAELARVRAAAYEITVRSSGHASGRRTSRWPGRSSPRSRRSFAARGRRAPAVLFSTQRKRSP